jgi:DNA-binding NarL/FixJ family response regulator
MRLVLADDHPLFRSSLRSLLVARGLEVVGEASDGREAVELACRLRPDLVLMDVAMPGLDGIEATRQIVARAPDVKVVLLTASMNDDDFFEGLRARAQGYLLKALDTEEFFSLLDRALAGEPALTPEQSRKVLQAFRHHDKAPARPRGPAALTQREREVLELMVTGITSNRLLARRLDVSENTVKFHVRSVLHKLHQHDRAQAVSHALRQGIVDPDEVARRLGPGS